MERPEKCDKCLYSDCWLTDNQAKSCEIDAVIDKEEPSFLEKEVLRISQTPKCNLYGSVEVWDDTFGAKSGVVRNRKCGKWDCPECGKRKLKKIRGKLKKAIHNRFEEIQKRHESDAWKYLKFLTLTCGRHFENPEVAFREMAKGWNKLLTAIKKTYGRVEVFKVVECHKDGYPHFHCLLWTKEYIPFEWIQGLWVKYKIGKFVNISNKTRMFKSISHVVNYITKYLTKSIGESVAWFKRWSKTRGFFNVSEKVKWWTGYELHKFYDAECLYETKQVSGAWVQWHLDKQGFVYCEV